MKELFDKNSVVNLAVICVCGVGLVMSILCGEKELAMAVGSGLVGYLGGAGIG